MAHEPREETLNRWLNCHQAIVYKLVRVYANGSHDRDDLFQEIALQLWGAIPSYRKEAKESTFVYQVALFAALGWNRKAKHREREVATASDQVEKSLFRPTATSDPRVEWLYDRISEFAPVDRSLVLLVLDGYSHSEIASFIGISESNVGTRLDRLKKKLTASPPPENPL